MRPSTRGAAAPGPSLSARASARPPFGAVRQGFSASGLASACAWALVCLGLLAAHLAPSWLGWGNNGLVLSCGAGLGLAFALGGRAAKAATLLLGAGLTFCVFQPYAIPSQALDVLALCCALGLVWRNLAEGRQDPGGPAQGTVGWPDGLGALLLFTLVTAASLLLLPLGRILENAGSLGFLAFTSWLWGAQPTELVYPLASVGRLLAAVALAWQWAAFARRPGRLAALWLGLGLGVVLGIALELGALAGWWGFFWWPEGFTRTPGRLSGAMGHPTWFGMFGVLLLPGMLAWPWRRGWTAVAGAAGLGLALVVLALSQTRAAWLLVALQAGVAALQSPAGQRMIRAKAFRTCLAACLAAGVLAAAAYLSMDRGPPKEALNTVGSSDRIFDLHSERYTHWNDALAFARRSPWLGYGHDSFRLSRDLTDAARLRPAFPGYTGSRELVDDPHQWYLNLLFGAGPLALALWLAFLWARLRAQAKAALAGPRSQGQGLTLALLLACSGAALYGLFQNLQYPPAFFMAMLLLLCSPLPADAAGSGGASPAPRRAGLVLAVLAGCYLAAAALSPREGVLSSRLGFDVWTAVMGDPQASGVYPQEKWPQGRVRWTGKRAFFDLPSGHHRLDILVRWPDLTSPLMLALEIPGQPTREWLAEENKDIPVEFDLPDGQTTRVTLRCSRVFVPRLFGPGWDGRYLGVAVHFDEAQRP